MLYARLVFTREIFFCFIEFAIETANNEEEEEEVEEEEEKAEERGRIERGGEGRGRDEGKEG